MVVVFDGLVVVLGGRGESVKSEESQDENSSDEFESACLSLVKT